MAPELLGSGTIDRRADLYSVGVILWQGLTGERLFCGDIETTLVEKIQSIPPRPSERRPGIPAALEAIVMRALALDPNDRFSTAAEMSRALTAACSPASSDEIAQWLQATSTGSEQEAHASEDPTSVVGTSELIESAFDQLLDTLASDLRLSVSGVRRRPEHVLELCFDDEDVAV